MAVSIHWLDANVFIDAENGLYAFDLAPAFWIWLEGKLKTGIIRSSTMVYQEILGSEAPRGDLHRWAKTRRTNGYWIEPSTEVQETYQEMAKYVVDRYGELSPAKTGDFLAKADVWIIAHAQRSHGTVVTNEVRVDPNSQTPKIPNVCSHFNVPCIDMMDMLRRFHFRLR